MNLEDQAAPQEGAPSVQRPSQTTTNNAPKLTSFDIAARTMPYFLLRAGVSFAIAVAFIIYAIICAAIVTALTNALGSGAIPTIVGFIFFFGAFGIWRFLKSYVLYMVKAGHVAVVSEIVAHGTIENSQGQIAYGTSMVKKYFVTANVMWVLDNLVRRAVFEIRRGIDTISEFLSFIPGMGLVQGFLNMFVGLLLNYSDESIFAYIFQKGDQNVWKSSADGIVLFAQNWKVMIKAAGILALSLIGIAAASGVLGLGIFAGATALNLNSIVIIGIAVAIFLLLKWAILDPFVMIFMVNRYLNFALYQQPNVDLYSKVQNISKKFRDIVGRSGQTATSVSSPISQQDPVQAQAAPLQNSAPEQTESAPLLAQDNQSLSNMSMSDVTPPVSNEEPNKSEDN